MEQVLVWFLLFAILAIVGFFGTKLYYDLYQHNPKHPTNWRSFALENKFDFVEGEQSYISGQYRDYLVQLTAVGNGSGTRITFSKKWQFDFLQTRRKEISTPTLTIEEAGNHFALFDNRRLLIGKVYIGLGNNQIFYEQDGIETDIGQLRYLFELLSNLADAYPVLMASGGRAIPFLEKSAKLAIIKGNNCLQPISVRLLRRIAQGTMQLKPQVSELWCKHCLASYDIHKVNLGPLDTITYCGCRICSESQQFVRWSGMVVAVLDSRMTDELYQGDMKLLVNWLVRRALFDFEAVEIIQATDEDVERFVVQVGNDIDKLRQPRYKELNCTISSECNLSENTMRILEQVFGQVEVKQLNRTYSKVI